MDQGGVIAGGGDNGLAVDFYFVAAGDDHGAAIVRPQLGEIGQGFDEGAVEEAVFGVGALVGSRAGVEAVARHRRKIRVGVAAVDDGFGFLQPHAAAD